MQSVCQVRQGIGVPLNMVFGKLGLCTMLPGRPAAPGAAALLRGAYVEFESGRAVLAALGLTETQLLDQTIQVGCLARCAGLETYWGLVIEGSV